MKLKGFLGGILLTAVLGGGVLSAGALSGTSVWATEAVAAMTCGLEPKILRDAVATEPITRSEFCAVALSTFERLTGKAVERTSNIWFTDCADPVVNTAYEKGLIAGKGDGTFAPAQTISRQDLCVMLQNVLLAVGQEQPGKANLSNYTDSLKISPYAREAVEAMLKRGILYGVNGTLDPLGTASREQALILAYRLAPEEQVTEGGIIPEPLPQDEIALSYGVLPPVVEQDPEEITIPSGWVSAKEIVQEILGQEQEERESFTVEIYIDEDPEESDWGEEFEESSRVENLEKMETSDAIENDDTDDSWKIFFDSWIVWEEAFESEPPEEVAAEAKELLAQADNQAEWDELAEKLSGMSQTAKEIFVYGTGEAFTEEGQARAQQAPVKVPVWRMNGKGQKTAGEATLTVHTVLAPIVKQIFTEIFAGEERFPIADAGGFAWRASTKSEHRQGSAIDLNWNSNMEATIQEDGSLQITTGDHWTPGEDPFSIPMDGDVVRAFEKYGFAWGGTAWSSKVDYMHFSFFGR